MRKIILIALLVFVCSCKESPKNYTQLSEEDILNDFVWPLDPSDSEQISELFLYRFTRDSEFRNDTLIAPKINFYKSYDVYYFQGAYRKNMPAKPDFSVSIDKSAYNFFSQLSSDDFYTAIKSGLAKQLVDCLTEGFSRKSDFGCNTIKFE